MYPSKSLSIKNGPNCRIYLKLFGFYSRHTLWIFGIGCCWPEYPRFPFKNVRYTRTRVHRAFGRHNRRRQRVYIILYIMHEEVSLGGFGQKTLARIIIEKWPEGCGGESYMEGHIVARRLAIRDFEVWQLQEYGARSQIRTQNLALRSARIG